VVYGNFNYVLFLPIRRERLQRMLRWPSFPRVPDRSRRVPQLSKAWENTGLDFYFGDVQFESWPRYRISRGTSSLFLKPEEFQDSSKNIVRSYRVLTMVYSTHCYCIFGPFHRPERDPVSKTSCLYSLKHGRWKKSKNPVTLCTNIMFSNSIHRLVFI
jgi:hypothetical protein